MQKGLTPRSHHATKKPAAEPWHLLASGGGLVGFTSLHDKEGAEELTPISEPLGVTSTGNATITNRVT